MLTSNPLPWAIGLPSLSDITTDTMDPFAALAIAGMSFRGGADCTGLRYAGPTIAPGGSPLIWLVCGAVCVDGADCAAASTDAVKSIRTATTGRYFLMLPRNAAKPMLQSSVPPGTVLPYPC